jgi:glycosyltransferase involved in cell wall biosynthesis
MPPLEAMACGCPVASSLATSLKEVCGEHAVALDPDDPAQMAGAIGRLIADGELRARLSREGPAWAARFTWERAADAHLAAYGRAASCASENGRIASGLSRSASRR